jgi:hypothetical protein
MQEAKEVAYDFPVELQGVKLRNGNPVPRARAVVRTDTGQALPGLVSDRYQLFTHKEAVAATQPFVDYFGESKIVNFLERGGSRFVREYTFKTKAQKVLVPKIDEVVALRLSIINNYGLRRALLVRVGAMVLRCLNGMTIPGGEIELSFNHTGAMKKLALPEPDVIEGLFTKANHEWNDWAERDVTPEQRDKIVGQTAALHIISQKSFLAHQTALTKAGGSFWELYNSYTNVLTHFTERVQQSSKLDRFDKLNAVFRAAALMH